MLILVNGRDPFYVFTKGSMELSLCQFILLGIGMVVRKR